MQNIKKILDKNKGILKRLKPHQKPRTGKNYPCTS